MLYCPECSETEVRVMEDCPECNVVECWVCPEWNVVEWRVMEGNWWVP